MNSVDLANERAFAEVKRICLKGLDPTTLRQRVAERLGRAVPFDGYVTFTMDPSSGLITHAIVKEGRWLTLQASRTEPTHTRPAESMVLIAPAGPKEVLRLTATGYGLSPREQEVVDLTVRGASTRQISQALYISEYTVKDHLSNIFGKVGVRGRRALVKRLYLDTIFP
jgi:DNA-binding CsgD family transcriptional regulator